MDSLNEVEQFSVQDLRAISEGDADIEIAAIESFLESTPEELVKLRAALAQNNAKDSSIYAHSIKGASKYVGATRVRIISSEIRGRKKSLFDRQGVATQSPLSHY